MKTQVDELPQLTTYIFEMIYQSIFLFEIINIVFDIMKQR